MKKVTLGGDRLGSGSKQKVELKSYERSTHDLGYLWRSTMSAGTLVPFLCEVGLPGDTFDIRLGCDIKTHPTIGPLFGSYKVQLDIFECPIRLYQGQLHNNKLKIGMNMSAIKLPVIELLATHIAETTPDPDNAQINPSCILSYLGIRGVGQVEASETDVTRQFNAVSWLAYWDIYKNYYANKQEEIGAVIHTPLNAIIATVDSVTADGTDIPQAPASTSVTLNAAGIAIDVAYTGAAPDPTQIIFNVTPGGQKSLAELCSSIIVNPTELNCIYDYATWGTITLITWDYQNNQDIPVGPPIVDTFDLNNLDQMREAILDATTAAGPFVVNDVNITPYSWLLNWENERSPYLSTQEGLAIKTYQSDLFNNWLSTEWIDGAGGINEITAVSTAGNKFTIDQLQLSKKVYDMLNRVAVSGGSYGDWVTAVYDHEPFMMMETPDYCGGLSKELVFQEVVSNAQASANGEATQPLGTLAGKGIMAQKHKGGEVRIKVNEISYIIGIISLTPRIDYSQGNKWDVHLQTMDDFHKPALDEIGFQELIQEQMAWWTTAKTLAGTFTQKSAGKQPAWINYMTNVNQVRGNFAVKTNEMFMTLNRRYEFNGNSNIEDLTTYIDPIKFNHIFANTAIDAQNFWAQISVDMEVRRKMSAKIMPSL